jgi:hypothetical protein
LWLNGSFLTAEIGHPRERRYLTIMTRCLFS